MISYFKMGSDITFYVTCNVIRQVDNYQLHLVEKDEKDLQHSGIFFPLCFQMSTKYQHKKYLHFDRRLFSTFFPRKIWGLFSPAL